MDHEWDKKKNFCICVIKTDKEKKSVLYAQAVHKTKTSKQSYVEKLRFQVPFVNLVPSYLARFCVTNKIHHHDLGHISDVLLNTIRILPPSILLSSRTPPEDPFCASFSMHTSAFLGQEYNHTKYFNFLITLT